MKKYQLIVNELKSNLTLQGQKDLTSQYMVFCNKLNLKTCKYENLKTFFICIWNVTIENMIYDTNDLINEHNILFN